MNNSSMVRFIFGIFVIWTLAGCAANPKPAPESPEASLRSAYPALTFDSVGESGITGLYEVVSGGNVFYFYP
jgi:thiol:disulfide interchange protein DsbC